MDQARSTLALVSLSAATLACALAAPRAGAPDAAVMIAILFASLTSSIAGFAFSAICGGILFHLSDDHVRVVSIMLVCSIANQGAMVLSLSRSIAWRPVATLVAGGVAGVPLGAWILLHIDRAWFGQATGALLLAYGVFMLVAPKLTLRIGHRWIGAAVGFLGGVLGASAALPSVPVTVWCQLRGLDKNAQRALSQPFILAMQVTALAALSASGPAGDGAGFVPADLLYVPAGLFGTQIGMGCYRGLSNRAFAAAAGALLIVSGLSFIL